MKTVVIIQARMGSTRLPGKVMKTLCGKTVLSQVIQRVKLCSLVDEVVVATTIAAQDNIIEEESKKNGAVVFRGDEADVLSRYYGAARMVSADIVVRVTSDCPLFDPDVLSRMLTMFQELNSTGQNVDYLGNSLESTFPLGLASEVFTFAALEKANVEAVRDYEREHVTPYIYLNPDLFVVRNYTNNEDLSYHRWTLDTPEDFELISIMYNRLGRSGDVFSTQAVLELLRQEPELIKINAHVHQKQLGE